MPVFHPSQIQALTSQQLIRRRTKLFVGGIDQPALHELVHIVLDRAVDDSLAGRCTWIHLTLGKDEQVTITDNSPSLPTETYHYGKSVLELEMTTVGAGRQRTHYYEVSGGLHGIGLPAMNALSSECHVEVRKSDTLWRQSYQAGVPLAPVEEICPRPLPALPGTTITFTPDFTIFEPNTFDYDVIAKRCYEITYLIPHLTITLRDERTTPTREEIFYAPDGLTEWIQALNTGKTPLHDILTFTEDFEVTDKYGNSSKIQVAFALQYVEEADSYLLSYVNTVETTHGGTHLDGFMEGLRYALEQHWMRPTRKRMILPGLTAVVTILHPDPTFESQYEVRLISPEVEKLVQQAVTHVMEQRPILLDALAWKISLA
jgi:DNA gyrase subunit B